MRPAMRRSRSLNLPPVEALAPAQRTVPEMLRRQAERHGERPLFVCGGERWTFTEACSVAAGYAGALLAAGIAPGDRVALLCGNRPELLGLVLGCAWAGAVSVPLNAAARGFPLQHMLSNSGAKILAIEAELLHALDTIDLRALPLIRIWTIGDHGAVVPPPPRISAVSSPAKADDPVTPAQRVTGFPAFAGNDRTVGEGRDA